MASSLYVSCQKYNQPFLEQLQKQLNFQETQLTTPINWIKDAINAHNQYRHEHGSEPLVFNETLCKSAQWTANANLKIGFMHTSKMPGHYSMSCGENLYASSGKAEIRLGHEPVDSWYSEELDYDYQKGLAKALDKPVGHFTQLVWKAARQVCVVYAVEGTEFIVAAHYFPRGNVKRRYVENVGLKKTIPKPKVAPSPWLELQCDKIKVERHQLRRFKCHYKGFYVQLSPKKKMALSDKESQKLIRKVTSNQKLSAFLEVPPKKL